MKRKISMKIANKYIKMVKFPMYRDDLESYLKMYSILDVSHMFHPLASARFNSARVISLQNLPSSSTLARRGFLFSEGMVNSGIKISVAINNVHERQEHLRPLMLLRPLRDSNRSGRRRTCLSTSIPRLFIDFECSEACAILV